MPKHRGRETTPSLPLLWFLANRPRERIDHGLFFCRELSQLSRFISASVGQPRLARTEPLPAVVPESAFGAQRDMPVQATPICLLADPIQREFAAVHFGTLP